MLSKKTISLITFILFYINLTAQEIPKFGKIPDELVEMSVYAKDSSAEAAILFDIGAINFVYSQGLGWKLVFERRTVIKILTKEGYNWADQEIELYHNEGNFESIEGLKGFTYNLEGGKVVKSKLQKASIFTEETNQYWNSEKFTMPDVKVGSVIEYTYRLVSDYFFNLKTWNFQDGIPTGYSEITTNIPEYYQYNVIAQGYYPYHLNELTTSRGSINYSVKENVGGDYDKQTAYSRKSIPYQINIQKLAAKNLPAMKPEQFTSTVDNYRMKVEFELESTRFPNSEIKEYRDSWQTLNKKFLESQSFGKATNRVGALKNELDAISLLENPEAKLKSTFDLIRAKISWDGFYSRYASSELNQAIKDGSGNIADINLTLTGALREVGFEAFPVLASTRSNGQVRKNFPLSKQFNYVLSLVKIGDREILLDAGNRGYPMGFLSEECINGDGWVVTENGGRWVSLDKNAKYRIVYQVDVRIDDQSQALSEINIDRFAYASFENRSDIKNKESEERITQLESRYQLQISKYTYENLDEAMLPLKESFQATTSNKIELVGDLLLLKPLLIGEESESPFKHENREYPVDFTYPRYYAYQGNIKIPDGYKVDELPSSTGIALPDKKGRFLFSILEKNGELVVTSIVDIKEKIFLPSEYQVIKEFFNQIVAKHNENIVFSKD